MPNSYFTLNFSNQLSIIQNMFLNNIMFLMIQLRILGDAKRISPSSSSSCRTKTIRDAKRVRLIQFLFSFYIYNKKKQSRVITIMVYFRIINNQTRKQISRNAERVKCMFVCISKFKKKKNNENTIQNTERVFF